VEATVRALTAAAFVAFALALVLVLKLGPVVLAVAPGHGVHLGDLLAFPALASAALEARRAQLATVRIG
jgi:hypothetical protein